MKNSDSGGMRWDLLFYSPDKLPGDANATGPWTILRVVRFSRAYMKKVAAPDS